MLRFFLFCLIIILMSCSGADEKRATREDVLFQKMLPKQTGIDFQNTLTLAEDFDVFRYRNFYNGGGVAIADINNDGLADVYLTSNMGDNKLFLNKGNWKFEDITKKAGVVGTKVWSTGVSMADVNGDGLLDIYVCNSGDIKGNKRENELFINNGDLTFTDKAPQVGLADRGFSTHAAFFDYDRDGDLDCYVLNNSFKPIGALGYRNLRNERDSDGGDRLYRNDRGHFYDVSEEAGIFGSVIGFGLGVTIGDINQDNWLDICIANDFYERDYLYINNHDGTFSEKLPDYMGHISMFSMGMDLADINNDGYPDLFSTDMLPEDDYRLKTLTAFETYDVYQLRLKNGYYHQFMRNMLHVNNQDGSFSEIGQLAGVSATDWSWGALITDFNNDTKKEILVCNGIYKDVIDQDFVEFLGNSETMRNAIDGKKVDFKMFVEKMPSHKLSNYLFEREDNFQFINKSMQWGLDEPSFSNGAAYGDLDNDGDLDLIVNNVNQELFVYKNRTDTLVHNNFLAVTFKGKELNTFGLGATIRIYTGNGIIYNENIPIRGFQSSMDYKMVIGLGKTTLIDSLCVTWPDDSQEILKNVTPNKSILLDQKNANMHYHEVKKQSNVILKEVTFKDLVTHKENSFNDFDRDRLEYHMLSTQGPAFACADLNGDKLDDFYLGGSVGHAGALYFQTSSGFVKKPYPVFDADSLSEGVDAVFFDADNDKDLDLYVVSGGSEYIAQSEYNQDFLYENKGISNGYPVYEKTLTNLPRLYQSGSCVRPADIDNDGDLDLFVGTRSIPSYYGLPVDQFILINNGHGVFTDASSSVAPTFSKLGMVTDATWFDYDKNGFVDLFIVGEWMSPTIFTNDGTHLTKLESVSGLDSLNGWWNTIQSTDLDSDGDLDFILGNLGMNSKFKPTNDSPITLFVNDFDQNGSTEPIFSHLLKGEDYPMELRQDMVRQMSSLKKKFLYYKDYANKSMADIFDPKLLTSATTLKFNEPRTSILWNDGGKGFHFAPLPIEAQFSPVYSICITDFNNDKLPDIVLGGNLFAVKPEVGRYDALHGLLLLNDGKRNFTPLPTTQSGLRIEGEIRDIKLIHTKGNKMLFLFVRNNDSIKFYKIN
jgi:hypothetical protein